MGQFNVNKQDFLSTLSAAEYNQLAELNNGITLLSGQNLDNSIVNQIAKAIIASSLAGNYYNENGTADNYILSSATFTIAPSQYYNGMVVRFITTNANATTTPTINVSNLGVKNIKKPDGSNVVAGDINGYVELRYNGTEFLLSLISSVLNTSATNKGLVFLKQPITIANNTTDANNDIDFTAGNFQFSDNSGEAFASAMTKRLDASWSAGNNNGGLDIGTKQANTWYYCYAIYNPTTQASDFLFSAIATSPTLPTGFTKYKLIGAFLTNASLTIRPFTHFVTKNFNYFEYKTPILDYAQSVGNGLLLIPLTIPNIPCFADISAQSAEGNGQTQYHFAITSPIITTLIDSANTPQGGHAFFSGQWDSRGQLQKIIYTPNSIISFHSKYTLGSSSTVRISTFGFYI